MKLEIAVELFNAGRAFRHPRQNPLIAGPLGCTRRLRPAGGLKQGTHALQLFEIGVPSHVWRHVIAVIGAIAIGRTAALRLVVLLRWRRDRRSGCRPLPDRNHPAVPACRK
jgi:hypothetical protein